jgi:transcriptional regulator GlxA family with amidase domain
MTSPAPRSVPVYVVLPPQTLLLDVAGPIEVLRKANQVQDRVRFDVRYVGPSGPSRVRSGWRSRASAPCPRRCPMAPSSSCPAMPR